MTPISSGLIEAAVKQAAREASPKRQPTVGDARVHEVDGTTYIFVRDPDGRPLGSVFAVSADCRNISKVAYDRALELERKVLRIP